MEYDINENPDGTKFYYKKGTEILHRVDGPAIEYSGATSYSWYFNGRLHRENGPALKIGTMFAWYINGKLHREDGPAKFYTDAKYEQWYINGKRHRLDGPAVIYHNSKEWWVDGVKLPKEKQKLLSALWGNK